MRKVAGRARHSTLRAPDVHCAFPTPRISLVHLKTVICACPRCPETGLVVHTARWDRGIPGVGHWVGTGRVGIPGRGTTQRGYIGIARAQPVINQALSASAKALQALQALRTPWLLALSIHLLEPI